MTTLQSWFTQNERNIELTLLALFLALLSVSTAAWVGLLPSGTVFRPRQSTFLNAGLVLQPIAALVRARSRPAMYTLLAFSMVLIVASLYSAS